MDIKRQIELIAIKKIPGFDPKKHMDYNLRGIGFVYSGGKTSSSDFENFLFEVIKECGVAIPERWKGKLMSVSDVVGFVEYLMGVNKELFYMDIKRKIELIAIKKIPGFDPKNDMNRSLSDLGLCSVNQLGFIRDVEDACNVYIPKDFDGKLMSVSDVIVFVERLKPVTVVEDAWIPCAWDGTKQCWIMSNGRKTLRSNISPNKDFCNVISCGWHCSWLAMAKIK